MGADDDELKGAISRKGIVAGSFGADGRVKWPAGIAFIADCPAMCNTSWTKRRSCAVAS